jgi:acetyl esterase/lipase
MNDAALKKIPPVCVFTSEFDMLRRDALHIVERLKACGKYLDL